jgi:ribosome-binding factor A
MSLRIEKINSQMQKVVMDILQREVDDPALSLLSITRVETALDLHESRIYFSVFDESKLQHANEALNKMSGFIRGHVAKQISMKFLPHLKFIPDDSIRYSIEISQKIEEARARDNDRVNKDVNKEDN